MSCHDSNVYHHSWEIDNHDREETIYIYNITVFMITRKYIYSTKNNILLTYENTYA